MMKMPMTFLSDTVVWHLKPSCVFLVIAAYTYSVPSTTQHFVNTDTRS